MNFELPVKYNELTPLERRFVRESYVRKQNGLCMYCKESLDNPPPEQIRKKPVQWSRFPSNFLKYPVHLQHNHSSGLTEGAVHAYCNAVLWQYEGR